MAIRALELD